MNANIELRVPPQSLEEILASRMGSQIQICRTGSNPIAGFVLGKEEQAMFHAIMGIYQERGLLTTELPVHQRREARFMGYAIFFSNEPQQCQAIYFPRA